jgi:hypothetical protein
MALPGDNRQLRFRNAGHIGKCGSAELLVSLYKNFLVDAIRATTIIEDAAHGSTIKLLGTCLQSFLGLPVEKLFREKLEQNCTIQLLVLDEESAFCGTTG